MDAIGGVIFDLAASMSMMRSTNEVSLSLTCGELPHPALSPPSAQLGGLPTGEGRINIGILRDTGPSCIMYVTV